MQVVAAHGQHLVAALQTNVGRLVGAARHVIDRAQVHDDGAMDLRELRCIELRRDLFERRADHALARLACVVAPGDERVLLGGAQEIDVVGGDQLPERIVRSLSPAPFLTTAAFGVGCLILASWLFTRKEF